MIVLLAAAAAWSTLWLRRCKNVWHDIAAITLGAVGGLVAFLAERGDIAAAMLFGSCVGLVHLSRRPLNAHPSGIAPEKFEPVSVASTVSAISAAAVLDAPAATLLFWWTIASRREPQLLAALLLLSQIALTNAVSTSVERAAFSIIVVVLVSAARPRHDLLTMLGTTILSTLWLRQGTTLLSDVDMLGSAVFAAVFLLYALVAGRALTVQSNHEIATVVAASVCGQIILTSAIAILVPEQLRLVHTCCFAGFAVIASTCLLQPRNSIGEVVDTLDVWRGRGRTETVAMLAFSGILIGAISLLPLPFGFLTQRLLSNALETTQMNPQPVFALVCLAFCGPLTLVPLLYSLMSSVWQAEPRISRIRWPGWKIAVAVSAVAAPLIYFIQPA